MGLGPRQPAPPSLRPQRSGEHGEHLGERPGTREIGVGPLRIVVVGNGRAAQASPFRYAAENIPDRPLMILVGTAIMLLSMRGLPHVWS
ncbi:MAG: hypothetical protein U1E52_12565 [Geminicoccaceae bacterium]